MKTPFITGTQAYGPVTDDSDIDIVMYLDDATDFENYLRQHGIDTYRTEAQILGDYPGYYYNMFGLKFNIIVANEESMGIWRMKTSIMRRKYPDVADREERIKLFNSI